MAKVLFANAVDRNSEVENRYRPLWPAYLTAYVEARLGADALEFQYSAGRLDKDIRDFSPDLVAIGAVSQNFNHAMQYARIAKKFGAMVCVGGPHISALPKCLTAEMDVGCIGEGEQTFLELIEILLDRGTLASDHLRAVPGIVFRDGDEFVTTPPRPEIQELDDIPHPRRSITGYQSHSYMFTSRGCPYRCSFCSSSRFWGVVRFASAEYVVDEISDLVDHGTRLISFYDDLFVANKARVKTMRDLIVSRGLASEVKFTCSCRANLVDQPLVNMLKEMGVVSVGMGLESGSVNTLKYLKGNVTVEDNVRAIELLKDAGIQVNASFVIGSPAETEEEIMETYDFIKNSRLDFVDTYVLTPLPGTPVWDSAKERGLVSEDMDWSRLNIEFGSNATKAVVVSRELSRNEIKKLYRRFRRQRLYRIIRALPGSPWLPDLPGAILRMVWEKAARIFGMFHSWASGNK